MHRQPNGKWSVQVSYGGKAHNLGQFDDQEAAARAYDAEAKVSVPDPILNFLPDGSLNPHRHKRRKRVGRISSCSSSSTPPLLGSCSSSPTTPVLDVASILTILVDDGELSSDDDENVAAASSHAGAAAAAAAPSLPPFPAAAGPCIIRSWAEMFASLAALPAGEGQAVNPVTALQSYAAYRFLELEEQEGGQSHAAAYATALRMLATVGCLSDRAVCMGSRLLGTIIDGPHIQHATNATHRVKGTRAPSCSSTCRPSICRGMRTTR